MGNRKIEFTGMNGRPRRETRAWLRREILTLVLSKAMTERGIEGLKPDTRKWLETLCAAHGRIKPLE